jgi:hypothetical protein
MSSSAAPTQVSTPATSESAAVLTAASTRRRPQERLTGHVGDPALSVDRVAPGVDAEQLGAAGAGPAQPEQEPDRRRLAGSVRPEVAVDLAGSDGQVERVEGNVSP